MVVGGVECGGGWVECDSGGWSGLWWWWVKCGSGG